jgi:hypothetical protein
MAFLLHNSPCPSYLKRGNFGKAFLFPQKMRAPSFNILL